MIVAILDGILCCKEVSYAVDADQTALKLLFSSLASDNKAEQAQMISLSAPTTAIRRRALELLKFHHAEDQTFLPKEAKGRVNLVDCDYGSKMLFETIAGECDELDTFKLQDRIGRGTSNDLFLAKQNPADKRKLVVKVPRFMSAEKGLKRLSRELLMMELASHPNVVRGIRVGTLANDRPFLMMEYVTGNRLAEFLKCSQCRMDQVFDVLSQISATVGDLHRRGIAHCDLNRDNIIITKQLRGFHSTIIDFGSSRPLNYSGRDHFAPLERCTTGGKNIAAKGQLPVASETLVLKDTRALSMMAYFFIKTNGNEYRLQKEYGYEVTHQIKSLYLDLMSSNSVKDTPTADSVAERFANIASRIKA
ncbi:MAG: protein kinase [Planctomycetota bacterium]|nr:protein kinase [Planctomycetota bacterium]